MCCGSVGVLLTLFAPPCLTYIVCAYLLGLHHVLQEPCSPQQEPLTLTQPATCCWQPCKAG